MGIISKLSSVPKLAKTLLLSNQKKDNLPSFCVSSGIECRFTANARVFNHPLKPEAIKLGKGVLIDGTLEVYNQGNLAIGDYTFIGNARIFCAVKILIGKGCWIADQVFIMDSDLHPISAKRRLQDAIDFSKGIF